ncbi:hypothetical protein M6B38_304590 [Iris pallida]|uniref:Uncharacterized protein n=1 Tax=Iris pallida TaxID=29817 RepID=A0AAX6G2P5_IRIPA|nr:hypothetical protein M6B38_386950 [Iris pallida]KAJ6841900.1 hypothetical protein M6B38_304590 [Iris pallida]
MIVFSSNVWLVLQFNDNLDWEIKQSEIIFSGKISTNRQQLSGRSFGSVTLIDILQNSSA